MRVDVFTQPHRVWQVGDHRSRVMATARELGFSPDTDVAIGSGGLALHGLDGHYRSDVEGDPNIYTIFDADYIVPARTAARVFQEYPRASLKGDSLKLESGPGRPASVTLMAGQLPKRVAGAFGVTSSGEVIKERVVVDGFATLPAHRLVEAKLNAGRIQDVGGALLAHVVACGTNHAVLRDGRWLTQIGRAVDMARRREYTRGRVFSKIDVAPWFNQLVKTDFDHPAFYTARSDAYRQAA